MTQGENRCIFCDKLHMEGIHLRGKFICKRCEEELLNLQVDEPAYDTFREGLKVIWTGQIPPTADSGAGAEVPEESNPV